MKKTLSTSEAANELFNDKNAGWSYAGARALVEWLEELEEATDEEMELDVVALRCDFSEYENGDDWRGCYFGTVYGKLQGAEEIGLDGDEDDEDREEKILEYLRDNTMLIAFDGGIIVQAF